MNAPTPNKYLGPMQPYPGLERWSRQVTLPASQISLHLFDTGGEAKTPVLLLHGLGDEADTWRHVLPAIQDLYRGIAPDLPGFGRSEKSDRRHSIPFFVDTIVELLDFFQIRKAVLVGHSTGAIIAHRLALTEPERVERLVLVGGSLVSQSQRINASLLSFLIPGLGEWMYNRLRKDPQAAYATLEPYYHNLASLPQADRDFLFQRVNERVWSDGQRRAFFSTLRSLVAWLPAQQKDLAAQMQEWTIPTQVVWGENDLVNPVEDARAMQKLAPSVQLLVVPAAGHNIQQEKPEVVAQAIAG